MARRKHERMSPEKKNVIASLIDMYDIQTAEDIQYALKDLLGDTIKEMKKLYSKYGCPSCIMDTYPISQQNKTYGI